MVSTLSDPASLQTLKEQFKDFQLSPSNLPSFAEYKAGDDVMRSKAGLYWREVGTMTVLEGQPRFDLLHKLMCA